MTEQHQQHYVEELIKDRLAMRDALITRAAHARDPERRTWIEDQVDGIDQTLSELRMTLSAMRRAAQPEVLA